MKLDKKSKDQRNWLDYFKDTFGDERKLPGYKFYLPLLLDVKYLTLVALALLLAEVAVNILMIKWARYEEVDYITYVQQTAHMMNLTFDYSNITGFTGPCVYPAGFLYVFSLIYYVAGDSILFTRYIFAGFYTLTLILVFRLYIKSKKVPPYVFIIICSTSYRVHETYMRHMFNDAVVMLLLYLSLNLFVENRWSWGSTVYSLAVSVKMNILLFSPPLLLTYCICLGFTATLKQLGICAGIQLLLGAPFLLTNPFAYLKRAFDFGRVFSYIWTVNWRIMPEYIFDSKYFHISLLAVHLLLLALFYSTWTKYLTSYAQIRETENYINPELAKRKKSLDMSSVPKFKLERCRRKKSLDLTSASDQLLNCTETKLIKRKRSLDTGSASNAFLDRVKSEQKKQDLDESSASNLFLSCNKAAEKHEDASFATNAAQDHANAESEKANKVLDETYACDLFLTPMFTANLIGVACSRSLHMQFFVWYYHSIPYLLWSTKIPVVCRIIILIVMELCWNTCCSTVLSSSALHICHVVILYGLYQNRHTQLSSLIDKIKNPPCCYSSQDTLLNDKISTAIFLFAFVFYYFLFFLYLLYFWDSLYPFLPENFKHPYFCWLGS